MIYEDLLIRIYLVGYETQGESCIFLLYSTRPVYKVHYSIVIDSYVENGRNKTLEILKNDLKNQKLDMLVWTHPHRDHYLGMEDIITRYCDKRTVIMTPALGNDLSKYDMGTRELMTYINSLVHNRPISNRYDVRPISSECKTFLDKELKNLPLVRGIRFEIISPFGALGYSNANMKQIDYNRMSIGMVIQIYSRDSARYFMYTGDMDEETVNTLLYKINVCEEIRIPDSYSYIKIPHHGSRGSAGILDILSDIHKSEVAATTIFRPQNLPNNELLEQYSERAEEVLITDREKDSIIIKDYVWVE